MIRFLKGIRLQLLKQKKIKKYLNYAIGEIILVVIGILIALQINNWNEQNKINKSININLLTLKENLLEDQQQLEYLETQMSMGSHSADTLLMQIKTLIPFNNSVKTHATNLLFEYKFNSNDNAFKTMIQSNELVALPISIRTLILDYYSLIERVAEREFISNSNIQNDFQPYMFDKYPIFSDKENRFSMLNEYYKDDPRPPKLIDENQFLNDTKLQALIFARYYQLNILKNFYGDLKKSNTLIINELEKMGI